MIPAKDEMVQEFTFYSIIKKRNSQKQSIFDEISTQRESMKLILSESEKHITRIKSFIIS